MNMHKYHEAKVRDLIWHGGCFLLHNSQSKRETEARSAITVGTGHYRIIFSHMVKDATTMSSDMTE